MVDDTGVDDGSAIPEAAAPTAGSGLPAVDVPALPGEPAASIPAKPGSQTSSPAFDSMVTSPAQLESARQQLAKIQQAKTANDTAAANEMSSRIDRDRARMEEAYKASAAIPPEMNQKWDSNQKSADHYTDPVQAFGSVGSVFAMLASSFAGLPMEAGLNAGAAAINAIHAGDEKAYNREYETWKANTDLAIKRHDMTRQAYNDAFTLMNSNINAGRTKMELAAATFNDKKVQALLENGMDKELNDLFVSRNKSALEMQNTWDKVQLEHDKVTDLRSDPRYTSGNLDQKNQAIVDWTQRWSPNSAQKLRYDAEAEFMKAKKIENPNWTPTDFLQWQRDFVDSQQGTPGAPGDVSAGKLKTRAIQELIANSQKEVDAGTRAAPLTVTEATAKYLQSTAVPTGNRLDDIAKQVDQYDNGIKAIDRTLAMIDKHVGSVGVAGYATRAAERLGNIAGSNSTDRAQIAHDIEYLQTIAPRLLTDSSGRPLSSEAGKINRIIAGLNLGDTTANSKRALGEIRELWAKMQQDNLARRGGSPNLGGYGGNTPPPAKGGSTGTPKWQSAPIVGPRSDISDTGLEKRGVMLDDTQTQPDDTSAPPADDFASRFPTDTLPTAEPTNTMLEQPYTTPRMKMRAAPDTSPKLVASDADYERVKPGAMFIDPDGNTRQKPYPTVASDSDFDALPEGSKFVDPEGNQRQKPNYKPLSYTAQTMYSMATNDKEKKRVLEKFYPGQVRQVGDQFLVDNNGETLAPGKWNSVGSAAGMIAGNASPIVGSAAGGILGAGAGSAVPGPGNMAGGVAGAVAGGAAGQYFNDIILKLAGVYDRTAGEELMDKTVGAVTNAAGEFGGRAIAGFVPSIKEGVSNVSNALPRMANKFLGTNAENVGRFREIGELGEKPGTGLMGKMGLTETDTAPGISTIAKESPHLQNVQEVFHEAFDTSQPRQRAAEVAYNKMGKPLLEKQEVGSVDDLLSPTPTTSVQDTGEAVIRKALEKSGEIDAKFATELANRKAAAEAGVAEAPAQREAILNAAAAQRTNATQLVNAGIQEVERTADHAVAAAAQGTNSGDLWQAVGNQLRQVRSGLGTRYRAQAQAAYETVPTGQGIDTRSISGAANSFLTDLPPEFASRFPALIRQIQQLGQREVEGEATPAVVSLEQLHNIRTALRSQADWYDLPSDFKNGSLKYFSHEVDNLMQRAGAEGSPFETAMRLLNENDRWYAQEIPVFNAKELKMVLRGLESGEPADPTTLYNALVRTGNQELTARTEQVVGPSLWNGVRAAQRQQWLQKARSGQFDQSVDATKFAKEVLNSANDGTLMAVQGREQGSQLLRQAQQIAMLDGKLPVTYNPHDTAFDVFRQARTAMEAAEKEANVDPLKALAKETRRIEGEARQQQATARRADPLNFLTNKAFGATRAVNKILGDEDLILATAHRFGETSPEFQALRQVWTERVFRGSLDPGKKLEKISPEVQKLMLGVNLETAQKIAADMEFIMGSKAMARGDMAGGMAAMSKVEHPIAGKTVSRVARLLPGANTAARATLGTYYSFMNKVLESPATARWLEKAYAGSPESRMRVRQELAGILARGSAIGAGAAQGANQFGNE